MLYVNNLYAGYGDVQVLHDISLHIQHGKITCVIGANGAGKSTLLRALSGTISNRAGEIVFNDEPIGHLPSHRIVQRGLIHCPEGRELFPNMTVKENLMLGAFTRKSKQEREANFERIFTVFGRLEERLDQKAGTLSGGEQQMCAIARGLMASPKLLMLDEPSLGLSPKLMDEMFALITQINQELGITVLLVEQNVNESLEISDYGYVLQTSRVVASGPSSQLQANELIQKAYLGEVITD